MSDALTSQPPPATGDSGPWGSFYTTPSGGKSRAASPAKPKTRRQRRGDAKQRKAESAAPAAAEPKPRRARGSLTGGGRRTEDQRSRRLRLRGSGDKNRRAEDQPTGEFEAVAPSQAAPPGADAPAALAATPLPEGHQAPNAAPLGEAHQATVPVAEQTPIEEGEPVVADRGSRRHAEPHVLVATVGGTIIGLASVLIGLLYMIGSAA